MTESSNAHPAKPPSIEFPAERLIALSDGVFAFAMTLLVLDLASAALPSGALTEGLLLEHLFAMRHRIVNFGLSFVLMSAIWIVAQQQFVILRRTDTAHLCLSVGGLLLVCLMPFSTSLLGKLHQVRAAAILFDLNVAAIGMALLVQWVYATRGQRLAADIHRELVSRGVRMHAFVVLVAACAAGLAFVSPRWSLAVYVAVPAGFIALRKHLFITM